MKEDNKTFGNKTGEEDQPFARCFGVTDTYRINSLTNFLYGTDWNNIEIKRSNNL